MIKPIPCIILDDEPMAYKLLADYAGKRQELNLLYAGDDITHALTLIKQNPDHQHGQFQPLIILDIQMPAMNGLEIMKLLGKDYDFIISSAYAEFALQSYAFTVIDYLLKPISEQRFNQAIDKYLAWKTPKTIQTKAYLQVRADRKDHRIELSKIDYIEGLKDYLIIHFEGQKLMTLETMKEMMNRLPAEEFIRIQRSIILPKKKIKAIDTHQVQHHNGNFFPVGETFKDELFRWFKSL